MSRTLHAAREAFVTAIKRETSGPELARLVGVLDALIKWSLARPQVLKFHDDSAANVLAFACVESKDVCWSARVTRGEAPRLEFYPPTGRSLSAESRADVVETINTYSRQPLTESDRLRIGFGALKNATAFAAVTTLLGELLTADDKTSSMVAS
jgi:hypothetical protein